MGGHIGDSYVDCPVDKMLKSFSFKKRGSVVMHLFCAGISQLKCSFSHTSAFFNVILACSTWSPILIATMLEQMFQTELWNWNDFRSPNCGMSETITARARMPVSSCAECPGGTGIGQTN